MLVDTMQTPHRRGRAVSGAYLIDVATVYELGPDGNNAWWATVQSCGPNRIGDAEQAEIAKLLSHAPEMFCLLEWTFGFGHERLKEAFGLDWYLKWCSVYDAIKGASS